MNDEHLFQKVIDFVNQIGIETNFKELVDEVCFLPGLSIQKGVIHIDRNKLQFAGDVLHEAGHIAVAPANERDTLTGKDIAKRKDAPAEEMMAIAWSYAACKHLEIDPSFVFHEQGYKGGGASIVENFDQGRYIGVPVLQWLGMTTTDGNGNAATYPAMLKWMRD